jgi:hypothetical protein
MDEEPLISPEQKSQHQSPPREYDPWGVFGSLSVALVCTGFAMLLVFILHKLFPTGLPPNENEEWAILSVLAIIAAGIVGGFGGAIGGAIRRPKKAMILGTCFGFALTVLLVVLLSSDVHRDGPGGWLILQMAIWLAFFCGAGALLGTMLCRGT